MLFSFGSLMMVVMIFIDRKSEFVCPMLMQDPPDYASGETWSICTTLDRI